MKTKHKYLGKLYGKDIYSDDEASVIKLVEYLIESKKRDRKQHEKSFDELSELINK